MSALHVRRINTILAVAVGLLILCLLVHDFHVISSESLGVDASQNVRSSVNLARYGIYSREPIAPNVVPGFRREPFPNFFLAFYLRTADVLSPGLLDQVAQPFTDGFLVLIKQINLIWAGALFLGLWLTAVLVFAPLMAAHFLSMFLVLTINQFFAVKQVDGMNTELVAGMILVWLGALLLMASRSASCRWLLASGVVFGVLALTKAMGAYVAITVLPLVALVMSGFSKRFWKSLLAISFGFLIVVTPWVMRNQKYFLKPVIAQGGGDVLLIRSAFNQMNAQEFVDAFYAYAPRVLRRDLLGPWMDLSDGDFSCSGRLAVFNRKLDCDQLALKEARYEDVRSFYQQGKRAIPNALSLDRDQKKSMAVASYRERPLNALITSFPIGWRGFWGFRVKTWPSVVLNFMAYSALLVSPLYAFLERKLSWLMVSIVPVSFFLFYGLFSHFLPRYSTPFIPASLICLAMLVVDLGVKVWRRIRPGEKPLIRVN